MKARSVQQLGLHWMQYPPSPFLQPYSPLVPSTGKLPSSVDASSCLKSFPTHLFLSKNVFILSVDLNLPPPFACRCHRILCRVNRLQRTRLCFCLLYCYPWYLFIYFVWNLTVLFLKQLSWYPFFINVLFSPCSPHPQQFVRFRNQPQLTVLLMKSLPSRYCVLSLTFLAVYIGPFRCVPEFLHVVPAFSRNRYGQNINHQMEEHTSIIMRRNNLRGKSQMILKHLLRY